MTSNYNDSKVSYDLSLVELMRCSPAGEDWVAAFAKVGECREQLVKAQEETATPAKESKPKTPKVTVAKTGGVKSKAKAIIDMSAAELKKLADKHQIAYDTVNFRKADEKDAFRSRVAKVLDRASELNYTVGKSGAKAVDLYHAIRKLDKQHDTGNYLPIFYLRAEFPNLDRATFDALLMELERSNKIELSTLAEPSHYTEEQVASGIAQINAGSLFFIIDNER